MEEIDLYSFFHTKGQANDFLIRLNNFSESIYKADFNLETSLANNLGLDKKDKFMAMLRENNVNTASTSDLKNFLDKLTEKITNLPPLSLTLAFEPTEDTLKLLNEWFSINVKKQFMFDILVDPNFLAGVAINFNGKHLDFSVKEKFEKILKESLINHAGTADTTPAMDTKAADVK